MNAQEREQVIRSRLKSGTYFPPADVAVEDVNILISQLDAARNYSALLERTAAEKDATIGKLRAELAAGVRRVKPLKTQGFLPNPPRFRGQRSAARQKPLANPVPGVLSSTTCSVAAH